jgi:hypothetical protein
MVTKKEFYVLSEVAQLGQEGVCYSFDIGIEKFLMALDLASKGYLDIKPTRGMFSSDMQGLHVSLTALGWKALNNPLGY